MVKLVLSQLALTACFYTAASPAFGAGPLGVNGDWDFVNLTNQITGWSPASGSGSLPALDVNGWPMGDVSAVMFDQRRNMPWRGPDSAAVDENISGTYLLSMTGQAVITGSTETGTGVTVQNPQYNAATNTTTAQIVYAPFHWLMQLNFANTQRNPGDTPGTGFTNLTVLRPGYPAGTTQVFTNGTLQAYANHFACNRFLGPDAANNYQNFYGTTLITTTWDTRVQVTDAYQGGLPQNQTNGNQAWGDAWEFMILLSNQTNTDMWINIPASADDDYVTQLATLIKNGDQYTAGLNPGLHVYLEYSNEVWNFGFQQATYNQIQAQNAGITDDEQYIQRTIQIAQLFQNVFGPASLNTVIRPVALWQYTTELGFFNTLAWAEQQFGPVKGLLWGIGEAPYYNPTDVSSVDNIFNTLWTGSDATRLDFIGWQAIATYYGIHEVGYESGPSLGPFFGSPATHSTKMISSEVHHFLSNWFAAGGDLVNFFALRGDVSEYGDWLLVEDYEHLNTPKMRGAQDILASKQPAITAGFVLPWSASVTATIDPSQGVPNPFSPQSVPGSGLNLSANGAVNAYLLRAPQAGTYSISLYGYAQTGAQVQVNMDDAMLGTVALPSSAGASPAVTATLAAGFHTLVLLGTGPGTTTLPAQTGNITVQLIAGGGPGAVPSAPMNLTAAVNSGTASLTWAPQSTATSYKVERSISSGGPYTAVGTTASNAYSDTLVNSGTTYYYVIAAVNAIGTGAVSPQIPVMPTPSSAPAVPGKLNAKPAGGDATPFYPGGAALLSWSAVPDAVTYNLMRSTTSGGPYSLVVSQIANRYSDLTVTNGTTYYYVVSAVNSFGQSANSQQAAVTPEELLPSAPTGLTAQVGSAVLLRWIPTPGTVPEFATAFTVGRATQSGGPYTTVANLNTFSLSDVTVAPATTYYYVVSQTNGVGTGPNSAELKVTVGTAFDSVRSVTEFFDFH